MSASDPKRTFGPVDIAITAGNLSRKFYGANLSPAMSTGGQPIGPAHGIVGVWCLALIGFPFDPTIAPAARLAGFFIRAATAALLTDLLTTFPARPAESGI